MAKILISYSPFTGSKFHDNKLFSLSHRSKFVRARVNFSFQQLPIDHHSIDVELNAVFARAESLIYTLADAAVSASPDDVVPAVKSGGWLGFISDAMEVVLKIMKDGLSALHVPYSYGFAIILLTVFVKIATLPLTKQQVESTLAMQNLQPKIKAIQERYAGNQGLLTEGFLWIPSLGGPTSIAARQSGAGISWLFPFVAGMIPQHILFFPSC